MVPFQKMVKIPLQNGTTSGRIGSKFLNKNGTFSQKGQKSSTKMVPFQSEKGHNSSTKRYYFRKGSKILNKNGTISEKVHKSSTKMVPFQKMVKIPQQNGTF